MTSKNEYSQIYVFAPLASGSHTVAGTMTSDGRFRYGKRWLECEERYPLDPINLPLADIVFRTTNRTGVFPVFSDAGPDDWGMKVLMRRKVPVNELERLLLTNGLGVGGLRFSMSRHSLKEAPPLPHEAQLVTLESLSNTLAAGRDLEPEQLELLYPGSSMGGARPKVTFADEQGKRYILKFSLPTDPIDIPRIEAMSLQLARRAGIDVANASVKTFHADALCVERFDDGQTGNLHYVSAHALFNVDRLSADAIRSPASYSNFARLVRRFSAEPNKDASAIFRRMIFNMAINNADDHGRNHGVLYNPAKQAWHLAPAFDLVPNLDLASQQALAVGSLGRESSLENALTRTSDFGLSRDEALEIASEVITTVATWPEVADEFDVGSGDRRILKSVLEAKLAALGDELR